MDEDSTPKTSMLHFFFKEGYSHDQKKWDYDRAKYILILPGYKHPAEFTQIEIPSLKTSKLAINLEEYQDISYPMLGEGKLSGCTFPYLAYYAELPLNGGPMQKTEICENDKHTSVVHFEQDIENGLASAIIQKYHYPRNLYILKIFQHGKLICQTEMGPKQEFTIHSVSAHPLANEGVLVCGTFRATKAAGTQGFYTAVVQNGALGNLKFYYFLEFKHFFEYLEQKAPAKGNVKPVEPDLSNSILMHDTYVKDGKYYLVGEFYYPHTESSTTQTFYFGNYYENSAIACFDGSGKLLWDQSLELVVKGDPKLILILRSHVRPMFLADRIVLAYTYGNTIFSKVIAHDGHEISPYTKFEVPAAEKTESIVADMSVWYDNHFLVYGKCTSTLEGKTVDQTFIEDMVVNH